MNRSAQTPLAAQRWARLEPFTDDGAPTAREKRDLRARLAAAGIRELPFPFTSALAIASDIDRSSRVAFRGYIDQLVRRHGLDFGDSAMLHWGIGTAPALGFLSPWLTIGDEMPPDIHAHCLDLAEMLEEHHRGNVDHFHAFLARGPRVIVTDALRERGSTIAAPVPAGPAPDREDMLDPAEFDVHAVSVVTVGPVEIDAVRLLTRSGGPLLLEAAREAPVATPPTAVHLFVWRSTVDSKERPPRLGHRRRRWWAPWQTASFDADVTAVEFDLRRGTADDVQSVLLHNCWRPVLLDRLAFLVDRCGVSTNLVTAHGGYHFYTQRAAAVMTERNEHRMRERPGALAAYYGQIDQSDLCFSTVADDPASFCRVFPELTERFGVRFVNPHGLVRRKRRRFDFFSSVYPVRTRCGGGVYVMERLFPELPRDHAGFPPAVASRSRARTFAPRLQRVLDDAEDDPGRAVVFYTHMGNLIESGDAPSEPYFDEGPIVELKRRVFGFDRDEKRMWHTRPSVFCDYALMLRTLPERVTCPSANTVDIRSSVDPVLETTLPRSACQLYGVTFYVDDDAAATVTLDGEPIDDLVRNPPDDTGRPSVTVAACGIRHVVFDRADPTLTGAVELSGASWRWRDQDLGGELTVDAAGAPAVMTLPIDGLDPQGAQQLSYWLRRRADDASFGMLLETSNGGRFFFGDGELTAELDDLTGWITPAPSAARDTWQRVVAPFHAMSWSAAVDPATCPLPPHRPERIIFMLRGPAGASVGLRGVEFGRPKTTVHPAGPFVVGGRLAGGERRTRVSLERIDADGRTMDALTDGRGCFRFECIPPGAYWVTAGANRRPIEVACCRFDVHLP